MMWSGNYALGQKTDGMTNVGYSYEEPAGGPFALCGARKILVYSDFVAFHVKRVQTGYVLF